MIILSASGATPVTPSYLYIDNLSFQGGTTGTEEQSNQVKFSIFPNPLVNDKLTVEIKDGSIKAAQIDIIDLRGRQVLSESPESPSSQVTLNVSSLPLGEYIIRIHSGYTKFYGRFIRQ
jgi:hypothetical protein